jgi:tetratricopeptide (TPR) repeat protein
LLGAAMASTSLHAVALTLVSVGEGPRGWLPTALAALACAAAGLILGSLALARMGANLPGLHNETGAWRGIAGAACLAAAAVHGLFMDSVARGISSSFLALDIDLERLTPGLVGEAFVPALLLGPVVGAALLLFCFLPAHRRAAYLGWALAGSGIALVAGASGTWESLGQGGLRSSVALLFLAPLGGMACRSGRSQAPELRELAGPGMRAFTGRRALMISIFLIISGSAVGTGFMAATRTFALIGTPGSGRGLFAGTLMIAFGGGTLLAGQLVARHGSPWRSLGTSMGLAGAGLLITASVGDLFPAVYLRLLEWSGVSPGADSMAQALTALGIAGISAFCVGAVLGGLISARAGMPVLLSAFFGIGAGLILAGPLMAAAGLWESLVLPGIVLSAVGGILVLLEAGSLRGRALVSLALFLVCAAMLLDTGSWDRRLLLAGPSQAPLLLLRQNAALGESSVSRDRLLAYETGEWTTSARKLLDGQLETLVRDGRWEPVGSFDARRAHTLAAHLPLLLGAGTGPALVLAPATFQVTEALRAHAVGNYYVISPDPAAARAGADAGSYPPFSEMESAPINDAATVLTADPFRVLAAGGPQFGMILSPPLFLESDIEALFSFKGLTLAHSRLEAGGILSIPLSVRTLTRAGIEAALGNMAEAFGEASLWNSGSYVFILGGPGSGRPKLATLRDRMRRHREVAAGLARFGLDDPLKILALHVMTSGSQSGGVSPASALRDAATQARFDPPIASNLEWIAGKLKSESPEIEYSASFTPEAVAAAQRRVGQLRKVQMLNARGRSALHSNDPEAAIDDAQQALGMDPSDLGASRVLARALATRAAVSLSLGRTEKAAVDYRAALDADPRHIGSITALSWIRYMEGERLRAASLLRRAVRESPWVAILHYRLGLLQAEAGESEAARATLLRAFERDPRQPEPLVLLGDLARQAGHVEDAMGLYQRAIALGGRRAEVATAIAGAHLELGQLDEAEKSVSEALRAKPGDPAGLMTRARIRIARGDKAGARHDLLSALTTGGPPFRARAMLEASLRDLLLDESTDPSSR